MPSFTAGSSMRSRSVTVVTSIFGEASAHRWFCANATAWRLRPAAASRCGCPMSAEANTSAASPRSMRSRSKPEAPNTGASSIPSDFSNAAPSSSIAERKLPAAYNRTGSCAIAAPAMMPIAIPASPYAIALLGNTAHVDPAQPLYVARADFLVGERDQRDPSLALAQRRPVALECDEDLASDGRVEQLAPGKYRVVAVAGRRHDVGAAQRVPLVPPDVGLLEKIGEPDSAISSRRHLPPALREAAKVLDG